MMLPTVILGLAVAACWGSADTLATFVTRRLGTASTTLVAQVAGLVLAAGVALAVGLPALLARELALSVLFGILLGVIAALAYVTLYRALALGPLAIASPLVSGQGGVTLLLAVVLLHEDLGKWLLVFLLVTFAGIVLSAINGHDVKRLTLRTLLSPGVALALISMLCFGIFAFGLMQAATAMTWLLAVLWSRVFSCLFLSMLLRSPAQQGPTGDTSQRHLLAWMGAVVVGSLDVGGLLGLSFAGSSGAVGVVGMIASAYGVIPLGFGILVFRERLSVNQGVGVALLIAGLVGVASPSSAVSRLLLSCICVGTFVLILIWLARWLWRLRSGRAASSLSRPQAQSTPPSVVQRWREYAARCDPRTMLPPSVVICDPARTRPDDPASFGARALTQLLVKMGFEVFPNPGTDTWRAREAGAVAARDDLASGGGTAERVTDTLDETPRCFPVMDALRAIVLFPGGIEPLAVLVETIQAMQMGEVARAPILLYERVRWQGLLPWLEEAEMADLIYLSDDPAAMAMFIAESGATPELALKRSEGDPSSLPPSNDKETLCQML